jgi:RNA-directed DNA polymerase
VNTGAPSPSLDEAKARVLGIQTKLHRWATADAGRRFDDLFNLVTDPAFLAVAWERVRTNRGARTAGVDGSTAHYISGRSAARRRSSPMCGPSSRPESSFRCRSGSG